MLIQGTSNPLVIEFDQDVTDFAKLIITAWTVKKVLLKKWEKADLTIEENTVICPLTEEETKAFPATAITIEAKGLDEDDTPIFWDEICVEMVPRNDKNISLVG